MIIAVNTRLLLSGKLEGIGVFTKETLKRICTENPEHKFIFIFDRPYSDEFIFSDNIVPVVVSPPTRHPLLWIIWFEFMIPRILIKYKADIFFSPDGYLSILSNTKQVAAIHDINFAHRPQDLPWLKSLYYNYFFPKFARKAERIVTVSEFSKADICNKYKIATDKVDVVYNGVNSTYLPVENEVKIGVKSKYTNGHDYFLYVGSLHPRKNICGLFEAFESFKINNQNEIKLLIVGGNMFKTKQIKKFWEGMKYKDDVIFTGRLCDDDLHKVLASALTLTFVPYFEGFGIPAIEAMSAGVPVISSDTSSLPEVCGDAALLVNPYKISEIERAMKKVSCDEALRNELIARGFIQKNKFNWDKTAGLLWKSLIRCL